MLQRISEGISGSETTCERAVKMQDIAFHTEVGEVWK